MLTFGDFEMLAIWRFVAPASQLTIRAAASSPNQASPGSPISAKFSTWNKKQVKQGKQVKQANQVNQVLLQDHCSSQHVIIFIIQLRDRKRNFFRPFVTALCCLLLLPLIKMKV